MTGTKGLLVTGTRPPRNRNHARPVTGTFSGYRCSNSNSHSNIVKVKVMVISIINNNSNSNNNNNNNSNSSRYRFKPAGTCGVNFRV